MTITGEISMVVPAGISAAAKTPLPLFSVGNMIKYGCTIT
jgi:hypothetical protein